MKIIALTISLIGIAIMLIIINTLEPDKTNISDLNQKDINQNKAIIGNLTSTRRFDNNFTVLTIQDNTGKIEAICNCEDFKKYIHQNIRVIGRVREYNNQLQIQADKIILINNS
jgi:DNA/RNA endonuclease YhcR with UshA esterase domain